MFVTLIIFQFEISSNDCNNIHLLNTLFIFVTLFVFHFEMSGNDSSDEQL